MDKRKTLKGAIEQSEWLVDYYRAKIQEELLKIEAYKSQLEKEENNGKR